MVVIEMEATSNGILRLDLHHAKKRDQVNHIVNYVIWECADKNGVQRVAEVVHHRGAVVYKAGVKAGNNRALRMTSDE